MNSDERLVFGNENAEHDPLLQECYINRAPKNATIIVGKWGTGKTAYLLADNDHISKALEEVDKSVYRDWYLSEGSLNTDQLLDAFSRLNDRQFDRYLKELWKAEIYRRTALVLNHLKHKYGYLESSSWKFIEAITKLPETRRTIWKQIPTFLKIFKKMDDGQLAALQDAQVTLDSFFSEKFVESINQCLKEISGNEYYPIVAIEPIETPLSDIEKDGSLAQRVVSALLNCYQSHFQPSETQFVKVKISIPWHRFSSLTLNLPQKIRQYKCTMQWEEKKLREFVCERIKWEFKRVKRLGGLRAGTDAWGTLFEPTVINEYCQPSVLEGSFEYILRHTHYRAREVQRVSRYAVEACATRLGKDVDYVLKGVGGVRVSGSHVKDAVSRFCREATNDLVEEARRRYSRLQTVFDNIKGLDVPFYLKDVEQRFPGEVVSAEILEMLWESGILGVEISCNERKYIPEFKKLLPNENFIFHRNKLNKDFSRWCFFEYSWEGDITELINRYDKNNKLLVRLILHPKTFENLGVHVESSFPFGK